MKSLRLVVFLGLAGSAQGSEVALARLPDNSFEVSGGFSVNASTSIVWEVLTDYEHIPRFVSSMRTSRVRETRSDGSLLVEQQAVGRMFIFSRTMRILLNVRRSADRLLFSDVAGKDFRSYNGEWRARQTRDGVDVCYHLLAQPAIAAPGSLTARAMLSTTKALLEQVRSEIVDRAQVK